jgi:superfamily II DNA or RNA helicase
MSTEHTYANFLASKSQLGGDSGFEPTYLPPALFPFQRHLVEWSLRKGRAALYADTGLGKTLCELSWAENVCRHTGGRVLILTPLAVAAQTVREGEKFGIEAAVSRDGQATGRITVANYERLHLFDSEDYAGVVCGESSILKHFKGRTKAAVIEFMRTRPYRLLETATPAPNDYHELGTSSEALGYLGYQDMLTRYFRKCLAARGTVGWGQKDAYSLRWHAQAAFWRWVCSWAIACRKPSDVGFPADDALYELPPLIVNQHDVKAARPAAGFLFDLPAVTLQEQREEQRRTVRERCEKAAALVQHDRPAIVWCSLNDEADLCEQLIPDSVQVSGADSLDEKESKLADFAAGGARVLVTKPKVAGLGLNFQHCAHQVCWPTHSFQTYYQCVRRSWRFGQTRPVVIDVITTDGQAKTLANLKRKEAQAAEMFAALVANMGAGQGAARTAYGDRAVEAPGWLKGGVS